MDKVSFGPRQPKPPKIDMEAIKQLICDFMTQTGEVSDTFPRKSISVDHENVYFAFACSNQTYTKMIAALLLVLSEEFKTSETKFFVKFTGDEVDRFCFKLRVVDIPGTYEYIEKNFTVKFC